MAIYYYPSCKFTEFSPGTSQKIADYLSKKYHMNAQGCCRPSHSNLTKDDTAVCICNTCAAICSEDSKAQVKSVWEILQDDDDFPFPDFHHELMTLQDCWRCYDRRSEQEAVRKVIKKMNIDVLELPENYENTKFCGTSTHVKLVKANADFAPKRFVENAKGMFIPKTPEEQLLLMEEHCKQIKTDKVICYCVPCTKGIRTGGKQGLHLMDLLFKNI
uniref:hypothetical protein n=1 Tax=Agathobacter sp. TaxID=2021311 RepID=UPI0040575044